MEEAPNEPSPRQERAQQGEPRGDLEASPLDEALRSGLESGRIHGAYLVTGAGDGPRRQALRFARALACTASSPGDRPCGACAACRRSRGPADESAQPVIDGDGSKGPLYRHIGDHPDLYWVERGPDDTRVKIGQIRALQAALRLGANEGGWRVAVIADAEWLNPSAQNALLRLLEEPPERTCLLLVSASASSLLATIRSRSVRIALPSEEGLDLRASALPEAQALLVERFDAMPRLDFAALLDWAEEYRGGRAVAAARVESLLEIGAAWLRERVQRDVEDGVRGSALLPSLDAFRILVHCRRDLVQRNANPQMIAERGLLAVREAIPR